MNPEPIHPDTLADMQAHYDELEAKGLVRRATPTSVSLEVPAGQSPETAAMGVLEQVMERMLPTERETGAVTISKERQENYYRRERVAKWLADKYVGRG